MRTVLLHASLLKNQFLFTRRRDLLKASCNFDILDPETGQKILEWREPNLGILAALFRYLGALAAPFPRFNGLFRFKHVIPFYLEIRTPRGLKVLSVRRRMQFLQAKVEVLDGRGGLVGYIKKGFFQGWNSLDSWKNFEILDDQEMSICTVEGNFWQSEFRFVVGMGYTEIANVSIQGKLKDIAYNVMFETNDYMLSMNSSANIEDGTRILLVAAVMFIEFVKRPEDEEGDRQISESMSTH